MKIKKYFDFEYIAIFFYFVSCLDLISTIASVSSGNGLETNIIYAPLVNNGLFFQFIILYYIQIIIIYLIYFIMFKKGNEHLKIYVKGTFLFLSLYILKISIKNFMIAFSL